MTDNKLLLNAVVLFTGFLQDRKALTGQEILWRKLRTVVAGGQITKTTLLPPQKWNADVKGLAEFLFRNLVQNGDRRVLISGYSYGGGWGAIRLCKELLRMGVLVDHLVMADAVHRNRMGFTNVVNIFSKGGQWRSIKIPANVRHVHPFRQAVDVPRGHKLKAVDGNITTIDPTVWLKCGHSFVDEQKKYQDKVVALVKELVK
jgi:hypothetical protein|tara:strand:+ start:4115 stop:4723 length:609 start_codon:yes stop_codon:yes gene_type:complete